MCGIVGLATSDGSRPAEARVIAMRDAQQHRGPDDQGVFVGEGVALGSRRLSILDLSPRGRMPLGTEDGRHWIVHNGEVYNYRALRADLEARGHRFRTDTDTEVILRLFVEEGPAALDRMNGMFAFAIWDAKECSLFLGRDRLGVKPLHYTYEGGTLLFSSEIKGLLAAGVPARPDVGSLEELLVFRFVAGERTPYEGVKRLRPGHWLRFCRGRLEVRQWWDLAARAGAGRPEAAGGDPSPEPGGEDPAWFQRTFDDAVALRRISDVPVGVLLSGGLDSGSVAASLASSGGRDLASFTVRFEDAAFDEGEVARETARRLGFEHHELSVAPADLEGLLLEAARLADEPLAHASDPHLLAISRHAKPRLTVLLCGEGGDETLGGYVRYAPLRRPWTLAAARPVLRLLGGRRGRLGKLGRMAGLGSLQRMVLHNACEVLPQEVAALGFPATGRYPFREEVLAEAQRLHPGEPLRQAMHQDHLTFLESLLLRNDRMTMGASIECRVPFLDYRLVEGLAGLPTRRLLCGRGSKPLLRRALGSRLAPGVLRGRKRGFPVPWARYLRSEVVLRDRVRTLPEAPILREGPFDRRAVEALVAGFLAGDDRREALVRALLMLAIWEEVCLRSGPAEMGAGGFEKVRGGPRQADL